MKRIAIVANCSKSVAPEMMERLQNCADRIGLELFTCDATAELLPQARRIDPGDLRESVDVLMALGGDGTLLNSVRLLGGAGIPVIGVNLGSLGFMTSVPEENLEDALEALRHDKTESSRRTMVDCSLRTPSGTDGEWSALNDIVIGWGQSSRIITLEVSVRGEHLLSSLCDGLIVSTPTGSTGHSMAAGGPIVHPESSDFVITAICPHTLSNRPLVLPNRFPIDIAVKSSSKATLLAVDGVDRRELNQGDCVRIERGPRDLELLHLPEYSYFEILKHKLHWRGSVV